MNDNLFQERIIELVRAFGWHRPEVTPCGRPVSIAEAHALLEISRTSGVSQNELARKLNLVKSTVSRLISKLVKRGWVRREQNQQDRRAYHLFLTAEGDKIAVQLANARQAKLGGILNRVPEEQRQNLLESIDRLVKAIHEGD